MAGGSLKKIIIAKNAGFCFGVKRAIRMAFETSKDKDTGNIYTLGPIIHNPQIVDKLNEDGVYMVQSLEDVECGTLIIRSHGVTRQEKKEISEKELTVVDATCPFVKKAQNIATRLAKEGYTILIVGDMDHPEVRSIMSYLEGLTEVITESEKIGDAKKRGRAGIIAQTTQTRENLFEWVRLALDVFQEVRVFNTICSATTVRQEEAVEISKVVDAMLIIGGYNSANTGRLAKLAGKYNGKVFHVEKAEEVKDEQMKGVEVLGISAGASTPDWAIERLVEHIVVKWGGGDVEMVRGT